MGRRKQSQASRSQSSQLTIEASFSNSQKVIENLDELVNSCVRYFVYRAGCDLPIRKTDLQKHVLKNVGRSFNMILEKVKVILKEVYGYDLYMCEDQQSTVRYLVSNSLPYKNLNEESDNNTERDTHKILIMIILAHIFMCGDNSTEASLFSFLNSLNIDVEENHEIFGNVKTFIKTTMVNQKFLQVENDNVTKRQIYTWGPRAEHEVSKHELLKFVCKIYKDRTPKSWPSQLDSAAKQFNLPINGDENEANDD
ncbi:hypothetical protein RI129_010287 [Pyrocoelia pectoralis]|uniref:MAGE domain-containing protein n=1 Tax=Pyrocoelia pectoralis TaxID=417401 RepID=A0AAN7V478_9COLE